MVFSANPVTGGRGEVLINANWEPGESVVGGTVNLLPEIACPSCSRASKTDEKPHPLSPA